MEIVFFILALVCFLVAGALLYDVPNWRSALAFFIFAGGIVLANRSNWISYIESLF